AYAFKAGWTQAQFSDVLGVYAQRVARDAAQFKAAQTAELAKLGVNAAARVDAISRFLTGMLGETLGKAVLTGMATERQARGFEKLMEKFASQGHAAFSQAHREPADAPGRVDDETYARMTAGDKFNYARQFPQ